MTVGAIVRPVVRPIVRGVVGGLDGIVTLPSGLPTPPITLVSRGLGPGTVTIDPSDAITAALAYNAAIANAGVYYVKPSTGSDSNSGLTTLLPFATVAKAMRTATGACSRVVMLEDCTIPSFDLRSTDASQTAQQFKWLDANGYNVTIKDTGPDLTAQTWVVDGTNTKCYKAMLAVSGSAQPTRVLRTDQLNTSIDSDGVDRLAGLNAYKQLRKYASAAALNAGSTAEDGWFWDNVGKVLWIRFGNGLNVESSKSVLRAMYLNSAGTSRIFVSGASLGLKGVRMEGVQIVTLDAASRQPEIWLHNCVQLWAVAKGFDGTNTGRYIATNHLCYASQQDGCNGFVTSAVAPGLIQTVNCQYIDSGDVSVFDPDNTIQGISAHGGVQHASYGTKCPGNNGQGIADTCAASKNDVTLLVCCDVRGGNSTAANYAVGSAAASASRKMYLDSCVSSGEPAAGDVSIAANGSLYVYNCPTITSVSGGSAVAYDPGAPP